MTATKMPVAEYRSKPNFFVDTSSFFFSPSLLPAADCYASNLCSRFGMFLFLSLWYFFFCLDFLSSFGDGCSVFSVVTSP